MPVELRVGSTGAGLFVGCGAGIGIVTPLSLHAVPVVGQLVSAWRALERSARCGRFYTCLLVSPDRWRGHRFRSHLPPGNAAEESPCRCRRRRSRRRIPCLCSSIPPQAASLATSLSMLNASTGGVTSAARRRVRSLGVPGLDLGFGCGVMLGYGWGAGLMLKPSALQSLTSTLQSAGRAIVERLPQPVQAALAQRRPQQAAAGSLGLPPAGAPAPGLGGGATAGGLPLGLHDLTVQQQQQQGELWYVALAPHWEPLLELPLMPAAAAALFVVRSCVRPARFEQQAFVNSCPLMLQGWQQPAWNNHHQHPTQ